MSITPGYRRRRRLGAVLAASVLLVLLRHGSPGAQEVTAPALKAAFLFNFVKFTTWPSEVLPDEAPVMLCVVNAPSVARELTGAVKGRVVAGHPLRVEQPAVGNGLNDCHLLYVSGARAIAVAALDAVRNAPVLTVSDLQAFGAEGGIVQLHVQQGQLRFAVALDAVRAARLQVSSRLLALSREP